MGLLEDFIKNRYFKWNKDARGVVQTILQLIQNRLHNLFEIEEGIEFIKGTNMI